MGHIITLGISISLHALLLFSTIDNSKRVISFKTNYGQNSKSLSFDIFTIDKIKQVTHQKKTTIKNKSLQNLLHKKKVSFNALANSLIVEARLLHEFQKEYPLKAKVLGQEGDVVVDLSIDAVGNITEINLIKSCGFTELDNSAIKTLSTAKFAPATINGKSTSSTKRLTLSYRINSL